MNVPIGRTTAPERICPPPPRHDAPLHGRLHRQRRTCEPAISQIKHPPFKHPAVETMREVRDKAAIIFWVALAVCLIVPFLPFGRYVLWPLSLLGVYTHELFHGLTAMATGGKLQRIDHLSAIGRCRPDRRHRAPCKCCIKCRRSFGAGHCRRLAGDFVAASSGEQTRPVDSCGLADRLGAALGRDHFHLRLLCCLWCAHGWRNHDPQSTLAQRHRTAHRHSAMHREPARFRLHVYRQFLPRRRLPHLRIPETSPTRSAAPISFGAL